MSTVTVTLENEEVIVFVENTIGHQVGNGAVQILMEDGGQVVYNNFAKVEVEPSEEEKANFIKGQEAAKEAAEEAEKERERQLQVIKDAESLESTKDSSQAAH